MLLNRLTCIYSKVLKSIMTSNCPWTCYWTSYMRCSDPDNQLHQPRLVMLAIDWRATLERSIVWDCYAAIAISGLPASSNWFGSFRRRSEGSWMRTPGMQKAIYSLTDPQVIRRTKSLIRDESTQIAIHKSVSYMCASSPGTASPMTHIMASGQLAPSFLVMRSRATEWGWPAHS